MTKIFLLISVAFVTICGISAAAAQSEATLKDPLPSIAGYSHFNVLNGNALVNAERPTAATLPHGQLLVENGGVVFVMTRNDNVSVFAVKEPEQGDIKLIVERKVITMSPGQEIVLTRQPNPTFETVNPGAVIPYRLRTTHELDHGLTVYSAEFSVLSLVKAVKPLKAMLSSSNVSDQAKMRQILKTGLILHEVNNSLGKFETGQKSTKKKKNK